MAINMLLCLLHRVMKTPLSSSLSQVSALNIFIDNASIAVVDSELINTIPDAECYLLCKTAITGDELIGEIASNPAENYYLATHTTEPTTITSPYGQELIAKLTKKKRLSSNFSLLPAHRHRFNPGSKPLGTIRS